MADFTSVAAMSGTGTWHFNERGCIAYEASTSSLGAHTQQAVDVPTLQTARREAPKPLSSAAS